MRWDDDLNNTSTVDANIFARHRPTLVIIEVLETQVSSENETKNNVI